MNNNIMRVFTKAQVTDGLIEKKSIFGWEYIIKINIVFLFIYVLSCSVGENVVWFLERKANLNLSLPSDIVPLIISLAAISISMFQIVIGKVDDRILGMSYKKMFLKDTIWKYHNYPNATFILLEAVVFSCILVIFRENLYLKILQYLLLLMVIYFSCWIFYLGLIVLVKKSLIYYKIKKIISSNDDSAKNDIISSLRKKVPLLKRQDDKYNSYLYEEIGILIYLIAFIKNGEKGEDSSADTKQEIEKIKEVIKNIIEKDDRDSEELKKSIKKRGTNEFERKNGIYKQILSEVTETKEQSEFKKRSKTKRKISIKPSRSKRYGRRRSVLYRRQTQ